MAREFCPGCGVVRNMAATVTERTRTGADGKREKVVATTYHCETCGRFVRSEESRRPSD